MKSLTGIHSWTWNGNSSAKGKSSESSVMPSFLNLSPKLLKIRKIPSSTDFVFLHNSSPKYFLIFQNSLSPTCMSVLEASLNEIVAFLFFVQPPAVDRNKSQWGKLLKVKLVPYLCVDWAKIKNVPLLLCLNRGHRFTKLESIWNFVRPFSSYGKGISGCTSKDRLILQKHSEAM